MSVELATAYVSLVPSTRGIAGQIRDELEGPAQQAGGQAGNSMVDRFSGAAAKGMKVAGGVAIAGFGASLVSGFGRLQAIDDAQFKLQGLGHDADTVQAIMDNALGAVRGTAFGLGDAATIAAGAVAAGIEPGEQLERTLSLTGDAATIAGTSLGDMGSIFGKVAAGNRMMTQEMNQLSDRGLPVLQWLQEEFGVTADEARDMVSSGQVDFATFQKIIEENIGGAALTAGESFRGSFANMGAAVGRFGAALLGPAFAAAPELFANLTDRVDGFTEKVEPLGKFIADNGKALGVAAGVIGAVFIPIMAQVVIGWVTSAAAAVTSAAAQVAASWRTVAGFTAQGIAALRNLPFVIQYYTVLAAQAVKNAAIAAVQAARVVAGWVLMGVQSMIQAARMAAAWIIAMGPVGWVIAAVVALVALIVANWDTVVDWTKKAWTWVTDKIGAAWTWITDTTSSAVESVVGFVTNLRDRAVSLVTSLRDRYIALVLALRDRVVSLFTALRDRAIALVTGARDRVIEAANRMRERVIGAVRQLREGAVERFRSLVDWVRGLPGRILSALGNLGRILLDAGRQILQGLWNGMTEKWDQLTGWIGGLGSQIAGLKGPIEKDRRLLIDEGAAIMEGLGVGLQAGWADNKRMLSKMAGQVTDIFADDVGSGSLRLPMARVPTAFSAGVPSVPAPTAARSFHIENLHVGRREDVKELGVRLKSVAATYG